MKLATETPKAKLCISTEKTQGKQDLTDQRVQCTCCAGFPPDSCHYSVKLIRTKGSKGGQVALDLVRHFSRGAQLHRG